MIIPPCRGYGYDEKDYKELSWLFKVANNYMVKPFTAETLKEKMDKVWQQINS